MFYPKQKSTGTRYTATIALLLAGLAVSPLALYISWPVGLAMSSIAAVFTSACLVSAWFQWRNRSRLTIPSLPLRFRAATGIKVLLIACSVLSVPVVSAGELAAYRGFAFGSSIAVVSKQAGLQPRDVKVVYEQPALIQTIEWQPRYEMRADGKPESIRDGMFSFLNGQLYRIAVNYDRYQLEGMTSGDVIAALSQTYGVASYPEAQIPFRSIFDETAPVLARWEDASSVYDLVFSRDQATFALVLYSKDLAITADAAIVQAIRMEALAAPQRAKDEEGKRVEDDRLALEKARAKNKPNFQP